MDSMNPAPALETGAGPRRATFWARRSLGGKVAISLFIWPQLIGLVASRFLNIVPSQLAINIGLFGGAAIAAMWVALIEMANRGRSWDESQRSQRWIEHIWVRVPFMACVGFMFGYSSLAWTCPLGDNCGLRIP